MRMHLDSSNTDNATATTIPEGRELVASLAATVETRLADLAELGKRASDEAEVTLTITDPAEALTDRETLRHVLTIAKTGRTANVRLVLNTDRYDAAAFGGSTILRELAKSSGHVSLQR